MPTHLLTNFARFHQTLSPFKLNFRELEADLILAPTQKFTTPVIVMEGMNYGQFASGTLPPAVAGYDLKPEISQKDAYDAIANYTNAFMMYVRDTNVSEATSMLEEGYSKTQSILQVSSNHHLISRIFKSL